MSILDLDKITSSFNKFIVTPQNAFGVAGFVFDIDGEAKVDLSTEITDHFIENNSFIQDHIAIKPRKVTLRNYVGELVYENNDFADIIPQKVLRKLTQVQQLLPVLSAGAAQARNIFETARGLRLGVPDLSIQGITSAAGRAIDIWRLIKNRAPQLPKQQQAYQYFQSLMEQKILVSVQTPFSFMSSMAIESVTAIQSEDSVYVSTFSITLKEMRFASTQTIAYEPEQYQGRTADQRTPVLNNGNMPGVELPDIDVTDVINNRTFDPPPLPPVFEGLE